MMVKNFRLLLYCRTFHRLTSTRRWGTASPSARALAPPLPPSPPPVPSMTSPRPLTLQGRSRARARASIRNPQMRIVLTTMCGIPPHWWILSHGDFKRAGGYSAIM